MDEMAKYTAQIKGFVLEMEGHFRNGQLVIDELKTAVLDTPESVAAVAHAVQPAAQPSTNHLPISPKLVDTPSRAASNGHADAKLGLAERKILTVLAQYPQGRTKVQVALLAGYSVRGGGFGNALGSLRSRGYMTGSDHLQATEAGLSALGRWEPLPIGPALAEYWYGQLGLTERKILRVLVEANGQAMTKQQVADAVPSGLSCSGNRRSLVWYPGQR